MAELEIIHSEGDDWPSVCPDCKSADKQKRLSVYRGWGDESFLRNYYECYHPWHFDKWQTGRLALMDKPVPE